GVDARLPAAAVARDLEAKRVAIGPVAVEVGLRKVAERKLAQHTGPRATGAAAERHVALARHVADVENLVLARAGGLESLDAGIHAAVQDRDEHAAAVVRRVLEPPAGDAGAGVRHQA